MKEKVAVFTEKRECSDLFAIAENKYRTEVSLYKDKKIVQEAGLEPARYCYHRHLKPARLPIPPFLHNFYFVASQQHNVLYMKNHWLSTAFLKKHRKI